MAAGQRRGAAFNLMEDAATAEISRAQVWQWIRNPPACSSDGRKVTKELFRQRARRRAGEGEGAEPTNRFDMAANFLHGDTTETVSEFLTLPAYDALN